MGCNNCTTTGKIALTQGAISIDASQIDVIPDVLQGGDDGKEISSIIKGGFFELSATDMSAHLDMFARPSATGAFEIALSSIPVLGFVIPGIGKAGAVFEPRIGVNFTVSGGVEVGFGVDVAVSLFPCFLSLYLSSEHVADISQGPERLETPHRPRQPRKIKHNRFPRLNTHTAALHRKPNLYVPAPQSRIQAHDPDWIFLQQ
jgi:hypothetical protein